VTLAASLLAAAVLALAGHAVGWLTRGGAIAAAAVGGLLLGFGGIPGFALLSFFFLSGSILTYGRTRLRPQRPGRGRTWRQVVANGGVAAVGALLIARSPELGWAVVTGAIAAALADTWGTEIGAKARRPPRLITTGRPVPPGTSGGITLLGTLAGVLGAGLLAALAVAMGVPPAGALAGAVGGVAGTLGDSLLGATVQGMYRCDVCGADTERSVHRCGTPSRLVRGYGWIDNDVVNLLATAIGAGVAVAF
jgi:uncharacterized protein (TIGR00297 family)